MHKLRRIHLSGFKSFRHDPVPAGGELSASNGSRANTIDFGQVTILLGANGAGKSNIVSFFRMLNFATTPPGALQTYVARAGGSGSLLHYGARVTPVMQAMLDFEGDRGLNTYLMTLADAAPDTLVFTREAVSFHAPSHPQPRDVVLGAGHAESRLREFSEKAQEPCRFQYTLLSRVRAYQFHDTSEASNIRKGTYVEEAKWLRSDAGNLPAFLRWLREAHPKHYVRVVEHVRLAFPQLADFVLEPSALNERMILLNWRDRDRPEYLFGPHQLSDGTVRFVALAALFLQPADCLPSVIVIDEPELGLHPYAITVLASMVRAAAEHAQVVLSTQSTRLVDEFGLNEIVVVEHDDQLKCSRCKRPDPESLKSWIERYSTSELWEKNVIGGRP